MPSIKPFTVTAKIAPMRNPNTNAPILKIVPLEKEDSEVKLRRVLELAVKKYSAYSSDDEEDYNEEEFISYITKMYDHETEEFVTKVNVNSLEDKYLYYFLNMLREYEYDSPLATERNITLRQLMYRTCQGSSSHTKTPEGKKTFKPFIYAQFNEVEKYDQGFFVKDGNNAPQQCSMIVRTYFNRYGDLDMEIKEVECEDGTIINLKDANVFNRDYTEHRYLVTSQVFYEEDKVIFSEIHKSATKIRNNVLFTSINKRSTFNIKTGRAYMFPTMNMYTKKKISGTIDKFRSINCISNFMIIYETVATEKSTKEIGKYIQEHCGLDNIISFEEYYEEYKRESKRDIADSYYGARDKHFRMLLAYNANPYVPYDQYRTLLEYIRMHEEHVESSKNSKISNLFHLKVPKKVRNIDFAEELDYNTFTRNNFNDDDREILESATGYVYNYSALYSSYKRLKNTLGDSVDQLYKNKEMTKETMTFMCNFFSSEMAKELLKVYTAEEIFKSLRTVYIGEKIKGANAIDKLDELFDTALIFTRLQYIFDIRISKEESFSFKELRQKISDINEQYVHSTYNVYYHVDEKDLINDPDFKLEIRGLRFRNLYCMGDLKTLPVKITQAKQHSKSKKEIAPAPVRRDPVDGLNNIIDTFEIKNLAHYKIYDKKYQKKMQKFFERYTDTNNIKFDLYRDNKLMKYKEVLYV